jgi:hypothetical protein
MNDGERGGVFSVPFQQHEEPAPGDLQDVQNIRKLDLSGDVMLKQSSGLLVAKGFMKLFGHDVNLLSRR